MSETRVAVALITRDDRILVQRRAKGSHLEGAWEFPGGKLEPDESWEEALVREVKEELGLVVHPAGIFDERAFEYPEKTVRLRFYWAVLDDEKAEPRAASEETPLRWVSARELVLLEPVPEANKELLPRIAQVLEGHEEPEEPRSRALTLLAWAIGFVPVAFVIAALGFLTVDNFSIAYLHRGAGDLLQAHAPFHLIGGDRAVFIGIFLVAWGALVGWINSRTARRSAT